MTQVIPSWLRAFDNAVIDFMSRNGLIMLRVALGIVFIWFGALKIFGVSPVADLVAQTLFFLPAKPAVLTLGIVEVVIGLGLLSGWAIRIMLLLFVLQMIGTFATLIVRADLAFQHGNLLLLTATGEFVIKNFVLFTAGLAIVGAIPRARAGETLPAMLASHAKNGR